VAAEPISIGLKDQGGKSTADTEAIRRFEEFLDTEIEQ
jgi:hypothetical protein